MSLRVLTIAHEDASRYSDRWARLGIQSLPANYGEAFNIFHAPAAAETVVDAVAVCIVDIDEDEWDTSTHGTAADALSLVEDIRKLAPSVAMHDGKQWRSIPIVVLCPRRLMDSARETLEIWRSVVAPDHSEVELAEAADRTHFGGQLIEKLVVDYRHAVLAEFDDMGFIIRVERGRYMVGPALKPKHDLVGQYYFGPADKRPRGFTTVHKENFAVQAEVEAFESLINREDLKESELQQFFESYPHFLSEAHTPLSQVRLRKSNGSLLIPDFVLKPIYAQRDDSQWSVLDLKMPKEKLMTGKGSRRHLSRSVMAAIAQLRDYKAHFGSAEQAAAVAKVLGHPLRHPKYGVLIGRLANVDPEALGRAQQDFADVKIVTYDEILERQQTQLEFQRDG